MTEIKSKVQEINRIEFSRFSYVYILSSDYNIGLEI